MSVQPYRKEHVRRLMKLCWKTKHSTLESRENDTVNYIARRLNKKAGVLTCIKWFLIFRVLPAKKVLTDAFQRNVQYLLDNVLIIGTGHHFLPYLFLIAVLKYRVIANSLSVKTHLSLYTPLNWTQGGPQNRPGWEKYTLPLSGIQQRFFSCSVFGLNTIPPGISRLT